MKNNKRITSIILTVIMIMMIIPIYTITVNAEKISVQTKLNELEAIFPNGSYFTTNGKASSGSGADECYYPSVAKTKGFNWSNMHGAWSCCGYAHFAFRYIFGTEFTWSNAATTTSISIINAANLNSLFAGCKVGDVIELNYNGKNYKGSHWFIFIGYTVGSKVIINDCNTSGECMVHIGKSWSYNFIINNVANMKRYHASNYDDLGDGSDIKYSPISFDTYYLKNKSTGTYLTIDEKKYDANISVAAYNGSEMQKFAISGEINNTYKLSPVYDDSLNVNPYWYSAIPYGSGNNITLYYGNKESGYDQHWGFEEVSGGYILHNKKNDSFVLGLDGNNAQLETKTGADDQVWILESATTVNKSYLDVNGIINGEKALPLYDYVTFDIYLNGELKKASIGDFYEELPVGTTYEIKNIKALSGYSYDGVYSGSLIGTVGDEETIVCLAFSPVDENSPQIIIDQVSASPGNDLKVKISLKNNPGLASLKLTLTYGADLTLTGIKYGASLGGTSQQPQTFNSPVILNWYNGAENTNGDIEYAELSFKLSASAVLGNVIPITATFNPNDVFDINEKNINFAVINGSVTVSTHTPGDINDDGEVDNKDVVQLFKYLSGWDIKINFAAADCNGDGERNNKDVVLLFKYLSGWQVTIK